jgi:hypothetical protein
MNIYILQNGEQAGPYTRDQLQQFLAAGQVQGTDLAWREGLAEWVPLSSIVPVLGGKAKAAPAPAERPATSTPSAPSDPIGVIRAPEPEPEPSGLPWVKIIVAVIVAGVLLLGAAIGWFFWEGGQLDASSKAYVDTYISGVAPNWSADDFVNHTAPAFRDQLKRDQVDRLFTKLSSLGSLKTYDGSQGQAHIGIRNLGRTATARYTAHATFEQGDATFQLVLLRVDGQWTIAGLQVDSPIFHH